METCHTIGIVLLVFLILPWVDAAKAAMLSNSLIFLPGLFAMISRTSDPDRKRYHGILDIAALAIQGFALILWPVITGIFDEDLYYWCIPIALFLVSLGWWENYVDDRSQSRILSRFIRAKEDLRKSRYFTLMFITIWKIVLIFLLILIIHYAIDGKDVVHAMFAKFGDAFGAHKIRIERIKNNLNEGSVVIPGDIVFLDAIPSAPLWFMGAQIVFTWLCFVFGKFACKICIQGFSFAFPVSLTVPMTISFIYAVCGVHFQDNCYLVNKTFPAFRYLFWNSSNDTFVFNEIGFIFSALVWVATLLSQTWIAIHIWNTNCERLASTEKLFIHPMYDSAFIDQSMALNRRRIEEKVLANDEENPDDPNDRRESMSTSAFGKSFGTSPDSVSHL